MLRETRAKLLGYLKKPAPPPNADWHRVFITKSILEELFENKIPFVRENDETRYCIGSHHIDAGNISIYFDWFEISEDEHCFNVSFFQDSKPVGMISFTKNELLLK